MDTLSETERAEILAELGVPLAPTIATEPLQHEIIELAAHLNAASYRWLMLVAEFDRSEGWAMQGVCSCAHWLSWRCGLGRSVAHEKVRVARALERLPRISAAFRTGEVSYSKVRAMTRVATPENEACLLNIAWHGTATHVERTARGYRRALRGEERLRAEQQHDNRAVSFWWDTDGSLVMKARLPAEVGARVLKALDAGVEALKAEAPPVDKSPAEDCRSPLPEEAPGRATFPQCRADALGAMAESFLEHGPPQSSALDGYQVVVHVAAEALVDPEAPGRSDLESGPALAPETVRRLACDAGLVPLAEDSDGEPLSVGRKTRAIPPAIRRALRARDQGCRFPGCTRQRATEGHHVKHWAQGGETKLSNLVALCWQHHRLVHEGGFSIEPTDNKGEFVFKRPDGSEIPRSPRLPERPPDGLERLNREAGLAIDHRTGDCRWAGEPISYDDAVMGLFQADGLL